MEVQLDTTIGVLSNRVQLEPVWDPLPDQGRLLQHLYVALPGEFDFSIKPRLVDVEELPCQLAVVQVVPNSIYKVNWSGQNQSG